jgi:hypothetical protein
MMDTRRNGSKRSKIVENIKARKGKRRINKGKIKRNRDRNK